jgi:uncharacterized protein YukE
LRLQRLAELQAMTAVATVFEKKLNSLQAQFRNMNAKLKNPEDVKLGKEGIKDGKVKVEKIQGTMSSPDTKHKMAAAIEINELEQSWEGST